MSCQVWWLWMGSGHPSSRSGNLPVSRRDHDGVLPLLETWRIMCRLWIDHDYPRLQWAHVPKMDCPHFA